MRKTSCLIFLGFILNASPINPDSTQSRMDSTPDLYQGDSGAGFFDDGKTFCGPVAASNALMWLAENGFENLSPKMGSRKDNQIEMVKRIAFQMQTIEGEGTGIKAFLNGVAEYIGNCGYEFESLFYQGFYSPPENYDTGVKIPSLRWIKKGLTNKSGAWLEIGFFKHDSLKDEYSRVGGHWVTLVAEGVDEKGKWDPGVLIVHDPGFPKNKEVVNQYIHTTELFSGQFAKGSNIFQKSARGYLKCSGETAISSTGNVALMVGAVVLKM